MTVHGEAAEPEARAMTAAPGLSPCPTGPLVIEPREPSGIRLSLVIPTFNESQNVVPLIDRLESLLEPLLGDAYELIVVDDDSPDRTWELALAERASRP